MSVVQEIDGSTLRHWMQEENLVIIDVREPCEYEVQSIPGAVNIPLSCILTEVNNLRLDGSMKIVMQCRIGMRSMHACKLLLEDGFRYKLYNLKGGIGAYSVPELKF